MYDDDNEDDGMPDWMAVLMVMGLVVAAGGFVWLGWWLVEALLG